MLEAQVKQEILQASPELSHEHTQSMLRRWFVETEGPVKVGLSREKGAVSVQARGVRTASLSPQQHSHLR